MEPFVYLKILFRNLVKKSDKIGAALLEWKDSYSNLKGMQGSQGAEFWYCDADICIVHGAQILAQERKAQTIFFCPLILMLRHLKSNTM